MEQLALGDVVGLFVNGQLVDRGIVKEILYDSSVMGQITMIRWEKSGLARRTAESDVRRV